MLRPLNDRPARRSLLAIATTALATVVALGAIAPANAAGTESGGHAASGFSAEFADPSNPNRPMMRLWMPLAPIDEGKLRAALADIANRGFGGVEIGAFPVRGGSAQTHGWNSDAWNEAMRTALQIAKEPDINLRVDFMVSANYPAATPAGYTTPDEAGSEKELAWGAVAVPAGTTYNAPAPAPLKAPAAGVGTQKLTAVIATRLAPGQKFIPEKVGTATYQSVLLDQASTVVLDLPADPTAPVSFTAPADGGDWVLTSYWFRGSGAVVADVTEPKSYVIDHLSEVGTRAWTDLWEDELLADPAAVELLRENGGYLFEDSLHLTSYQLWTDDFLDEFEARRGYDLTPFLPTILIPDLNNYFVGRANADAKLGTFEYAPGVGQKIRNDYYQTLTDLYIENHIVPTREWAADYNLGLRYQPSYGQSLEQSAAVFEVDIPETESFQNNNEIDAYRYTAAAAHAADRNVISTECCATPGTTNAFGWQNTLPIVEGNFAGGVNNVVFHGYSYNVSPDATWPGWIRFGQNSFSENYGKQPSWQFAEPVIDYLAREQTVLREGRAVTDVAVYRHSYSDQVRTTGAAPKYYADGGSLQSAGYSYGFVSPAMLEREDFRVVDRRLDADGAAYSAIIVGANTRLTLDAAERLRDAAEAGLTVIFVGATPTASPWYAERDADIAGIVAEIVASGSAIRVADTAQVPAALAAAGIDPDADPEAVSTAISVHRKAQGVDYYYLYNTAGTPLTLDYTFEGDGRPFELDAWTGEISPIAEYTRVDDGARTAVELEPNGTAIIAVSQDWVDAKLDRVPSVVSTNAAGAEYTDKTIVLLADENGKVSAQLGNGRTVTGIAKRVPAVTLGDDWQLDVVSWEQSDRSDPYAIKEVETTRQVSLDAEGRLPAWTAIPGLEDVSGIGKYRGSLQIDGSWRKDSRAVLDLGAVYDTVRVTVNGVEIVGVDPRNPVADISAAVRAGANEIQIEVGTTLRNRMRVISGPAATPSTGARQNYGVFGPVSVNAMQEVTIQPGDWLKPAR